MNTKQFRQLVNVIIFAALFVGAQVQRLSADAGTRALGNLTTMFTCIAVLFLLRSLDRPDSKWWWW